jgi:uncharacterized protein (TIGR00288 family)
MTEKVLNILRRQSKNICCVSDGDLFEKIPSSSIEFLLEQIQEIGSIRKNIVVFDYQVKPEISKFLIKRGFSPVIVPSDKDVYLAIECLDIVNSQQADILCLGAIEKNQLPVVISAREKLDILLIAQTKEDAKDYMPFVDYLVTIEDLLKK